MRNRSGFTLTEMLVTVAVFSLLAGAALPSIRTLIQSNQLRAATNQFESALRQTRTLAKTKDQTTILCITSVTGAQVSYQVGIGTCGSLTTVLSSDTFLPQMVLALSNYPSSGVANTYQIQFDSRGRVSSPALISPTTIPTATLTYTGNTAAGSRSVYALTILGKVASS